MLSRIGFRSARARSSASGPHGYQSTGLCACCSRYGLVSFARRLGIASPCVSGLTTHRAMSMPLFDTPLRGFAPLSDMATKATLLPLYRCLCIVFTTDREEAIDGHV